MESDFLTVTELAEKLHVKKSTVYAWSHRREIPHIKLGKNLLFEPEKISEWLKEKEVAPVGRG